MLEARIYIQTARRQLVAERAALAVAFDLADFLMLQSSVGADEIYLLGLQSWRKFYREINLLAVVIVHDQQRHIALRHLAQRRRINMRPRMQRTFGVDIEYIRVRPRVAHQRRVTVKRRIDAPVTSVGRFEKLPAPVDIAGIEET